MMEETEAHTYLVIGGCVKRSILKASWCNTQFLDDHFIGIERNLLTQSFLWNARQFIQEKCMTEIFTLIIGYCDRFRIYGLFLNSQVTKGEIEHDNYSIYLMDWNRKWLSTWPWTCSGYIDLFWEASFLPAQWLLGRHPWHLQMDRMVSVCYVVDRSRRFLEIVLFWKIRLGNPFDVLHWVHYALLLDLTDDQWISPKKLWWRTFAPERSYFYFCFIKKQKTGKPV